jgi:hypothetical protein
MRRIAAFTFYISLSISHIHFTAINTPKAVFSRQICRGSVKGIVPEGAQLMCALFVGRI